MVDHAALQPVAAAFHHVQRATSVGSYRYVLKKVGKDSMQCLDDLAAKTGQG